MELVNTALRVISYSCHRSYFCHFLWLLSLVTSAQHFSKLSTLTKAILLIQDHSYVKEPVAWAASSKQNWTTLLAFKVFILLTCCSSVTSCTTFWGCGKTRDRIYCTWRKIHPQGPCSCRRHLGGFGCTFTVNSKMCLTVNDCSIPISLVAHEVVSPQGALLSEKEQMNG